MLAGQLCFRGLKSLNRCVFVSPKGEGGSGNYVASGYSVYEEENEHLQEGLRAKVSALKSVSNC